MTARPTYHLTVEAMPNTDWTNDPDGIRRLRWLLKRLGRGAGLRCIEIRPAKEDQQTPGKPESY